MRQPGTQIFFILFFCSFLIWGQTSNRREVTSNTGEFNNQIVNQILGGWEVVHPKIPLIDYTSCWFRDSLYGFAAGNYGTILKTIDGGKTFSTVSSGDTRYINRINSFDGETIIAVGQSGLILRSSDTGETWTSIALQTNLNLWSIEYRDTNEVWISGINNALFKSFDNGKTWQTVLTEYTRTNWEIDYWNKELGVIACDSGKVLITKNGGDTWTEIQTPETQGIYAIKFLGPNKVVMGTATGALYFSEDTGSTWKKSEQVKLGTPIENIAFADSLNGFGVVSNHIFHQVTTDGGRTWQIKYPLMGNQFAYFIDANYGYNIGYNMEFWKTSDGGKKWSKVIVNDKLTDIQFLENGEVLVGSNENLLRTDDKFTAFERDSSLGPTPYIYFIDKNIGFVYCDFGAYSRLYRTSDTGNTWKIVDSNLVLFKKMKFINKDIGFLNDSYHVKKTTDSGNTWESIYSSYRYVQAFTFFNENLGWVFEDTLYSTTNSGKNWTLLQNTGDLGAYDIEFVSEKEGWIVTTYSPTNYHTNDGGITWEKRNDMFGANISFYNDTIGFVLGSAFWETTNSGQTWQEDASIKNYSVNKLRFHTKPDGKIDLYLVGNNGLILKKTDAIILDIKESNQQENNAVISSYPNPFTNTVTLNFMAEQLTDAKLELYNILGERILQQTVNIGLKGRNTYSIKGLDNLTPGIYFIKINYSNKNVLHKILKLK